jgi:hypothetical protein
MPRLIGRGVAARLVHADPPYGERQAPWDGERPPDSIWDLLFQITAAGGVLYYWGFWQHADWILSNARRAGFTPLSRLNWWFRTGMPQKHTFREDVEDCHYFSKGTPGTFNADVILEPYEDKSNYERYGREGKHPGRVWMASRVFHNHPENVGHETQKPQAIVEKIIRVSSNPGDLIIDPFMGSNTTGAVCVPLGRSYIGIDSSAECCATGEARMKRAQGMACDIPRLARTERILPLFATA